MQFIIPIETKVRELESKILLLSKILSKKKKLLNIIRKL